jgi:CheY-like chemotaxis protein
MDTHDVGTNIAADVVRPLPVAREWREHPRIVVAGHDPDLTQLLTELLRPEYDVVTLDGAPTLAGFDAAQPDAILLGTSACRSQAALRPHEIATLASRHMRLQRVPMIVLAATADPLTDARQFSDASAVTVIRLPFDAISFLSAVRSVAQAARVELAGRIPDVCVHGFGAADDGCHRCD